MQASPSLATRPGAPVIAVRNLHKAFASGRDTFVALDDISFAIEEGEFISIVGPSGCGKSTLMQIVGGLDSPTRGDVLIDGEPLLQPQPGKIAIIFQDALLLPWKTALENVAFPLELQGVPKPQRIERSLAMFDMIGLRNFADHFPKQLSGGMRQRISIARGLAQDPRIILMDEPFGALDEQTRTKMGSELLQIWQVARKTVLFITHSLVEAIFLSDRVLVMGKNPGRIIEVIDIPFARPREIDMIDTGEFGAIRNHIWHLLSS